MTPGNGLAAAVPAWYKRFAMTARPRNGWARAILTDVQFWLPFAVLILGIGVLALIVRA